MKLVLVMGGGHSYRIGERLSECARVGDYDTVAVDDAAAGTFAALHLYHRRRNGLHRIRQAT